MIQMKCRQCGFNNRNNAKFCTKCGNPLKKPSRPVIQQKPKDSNKSWYIIIILIAVILILAVAVGYFALKNNADTPQENNVDSGSENTPAGNIVQNHTDTPTQIEKSKSWVSIGKYSGSGTGTETIIVPEGEIMVKLSAYPIKNYASNYLTVSGSNGISGSVDWGSNSAVKEKSDSFTYTSTSDETFTIDYYETVSWNVEFFIME